MNKNKYIAAFLLLIFSYSVVANASGGMLCSTTSQHVKFGRLCCCENVTSPSDGENSGGLGYQASSCNGSIELDKIIMTVVIKNGDEYHSIQSLCLSSVTFNDCVKLFCPRSNPAYDNAIQSPPVFISISALRC